MGLVAGPAGALEVEDVDVISIRPGGSAVVVIEGGPPLTLYEGESVGAVKLLQVYRDGALLDIDGVEEERPLVPHDRTPAATSRDVTLRLRADRRGHFYTRGTIDGRPVQFVVDTGATTIALSSGEAERLGLSWRRGEVILVSTANGKVEGRRIWLDSVRIDKIIVRNVEAIVLDTELSIALLGMSFLGQLDMRTEGSTLVLRQSK